MPRIERTADVVWEGNLARGTGHITGGSGALDALPYSLPTRIGKAEGKTSPEELLAAAHAELTAVDVAARRLNEGAFGRSLLHVVRVHEAGVDQAVQRDGILRVGQRREQAGRDRRANEKLPAQD